MASIPSNFEINVAKKRNPEDKYGTFFCNIEIKVPFESLAEEKLVFFRELFGEEYHVSMTYWECKGHVKKDWE